MFVAARRVMVALTEVGRARETILQRIEAAKLRRPDVSLDIERFTFIYPFEIATVTATTNALHLGWPDLEIMTLLYRIGSTMNSFTWWSVNC